MIPAGAKVFLASHPVDFRKGPDGLLALVREAGSDPFLCVVRDYVAAAEPMTALRRFAALCGSRPPHNLNHFSSGRRTSRARGERTCWNIISSTRGFCAA